MTKNLFLADDVREASGRPQVFAAIATCLTALVVTLILLPLASRAGPAIPSFILINQTALLIAYLLGAWVLFRQFQRDGSMAVNILAAGTLYTAAIILLQMLSFPGVAASGRVLGNGPETTTWLWTFWHLGPPACAILYVIERRRPRATATSPAIDRGQRIATATVIALCLAAAAAVISTAGLPWLPHQVTGDDYSDVAFSGIGPAVQILTLAALAAVWLASRRQRTVLDVWLSVSLVLLVMDNFLTLAGGARASVGWYAGRIEATISAFAILWAYLTEVDALRVRAEAAAEAIEKSEAALRQAQKMEAIGRLTGGVAHDFNNLLMVVGGGFEMIKRRPTDQARILKATEAGMDAVQRGSKLTRQLLTFARRQVLKPETVNPNALLLHVEASLRRTVGDTTALRVEMNPTLHPTRIDADEFETAVLNLVSNARDAMAGRLGRITVSTRNEAVYVVAPDTTDQLAAGDYVVVSVTDDGIGMDQATLMQVFEPFFTTKEFGRSSGLGLSQVYGFARAAGGRVSLASTLGQGTCVEMWLPRAAVTVVPKAQPQLPPQSGASSLRRAAVGETVLAVEDEPEVLATVVETLTDLGYQVLQANNAAEAMDILRSPEKVDLLFSDIVMPGGMNGVQLAVEASRIRPGINIVLTSGFTGEALDGEHDVPDDVSILTKPYRQHELAERLRLASSR